MTKSHTESAEKRISVVPLSEIEKDLKTKIDETIQDIQSSMEEKADQFVEQILSLDLKEFDVQQSTKNAIEDLALDLQKQAAKQSHLLKSPIQDLSKRADDKLSCEDTLLLNGQLLLQIYNSLTDGKKELFLDKPTIF